MSDEQSGARRSFTETAKDALSMAAEKAREMAQYATGAALNAAENVKEMATGGSAAEQQPAVDGNRQVADPKLSQPWDIGAPSALPGPIESDGLKYGCKKATPEEISPASLHALGHPTSSLKIS